LALSHTTFFRRINESIKPARIIEVGTRAVCKEELAYAKEAGIDFLTSNQILKQGAKQTSTWLRKELGKYKSIYVSVDMDILDPAYAPAVQNPEPDGLGTNTLLDILESVCDNRVLGFDVLEVAPNYDQGVSAIQAARIICEMLCFIEKSKEI
jgi:agmatinase